MSTKHTRMLSSYGPYAPKAASSYAPKAADLPHKTLDLHAENDKLREYIAVINKTCDDRLTRIDALERKRSYLQMKNDNLQEKVDTVNALLATAKARLERGDRGSHEREEWLERKVDDAEKVIAGLLEEVRRLTAPQKKVHFGERTYW
ncbi:hypothetical protein XPA_005671 [Xanthoria parietina]